ncbi:hypothetical protein LEP1GSC188_3302 [Leptospira weilii serovar Topaz str. LT2116]|uniref:Uncharacterized protein n=1 Tax=Leptospira weilii serovar Topaz str. LT2116 TaxID=1088540 RepID=M3EMB2_9LEPT|nr:hypothetical protein LEP1GSC188_3302 [Leptospira weilii serovar Topaz str. LT2116]
MDVRFHTLEALSVNPRRSIANLNRRNASLLNESFVFSESVEPDLKIVSKPPLNLSCYFEKRLHII